MDRHQFVEKIVKPCKCHYKKKCKKLEKALRHHIRIYECSDDLYEDEQQVQEDRIFNRMMGE